MRLFDADLGYHRFSLRREQGRGIYRGIYLWQERKPIMKTARLFTNGRSQAVRLPKDCRFEGSDVYVKKYQDLVILFPKDNPWGPLLDSLEGFSDDFMEQREQPPTQGRDEL